MELREFQRVIDWERKNPNCTGAISLMWLLSVSPTGNESSILWCGKFSMWYIGWKVHENLYVLFPLCIGSINSVYHIHRSCSTVMDCDSLWRDCYTSLHVGSCYAVFNIFHMFVKTKNQKVMQQCTLKWEDLNPVSFLLFHNLLLAMLTLCFGFMRNLYFCTPILNPSILICNATLCVFSTFLK